MKLYRCVLTALCVCVMSGLMGLKSSAVAAPLMGPNPAWKKLAVGHRPVMVILMDYDDVRFARTAKQTKTHFQHWFFSKTTFPSLFRFLKENSFGRLHIKSAGDMMVVRAIDRPHTDADESSFECMGAWRPSDGKDHLPIPAYKQWVVEPVGQGGIVRLRAAKKQSWALNIEHKNSLGHSPALGPFGKNWLSARWRKIPTTKGHFRLRSVWKSTLYLGTKRDLVVLSKSGIEWTQVKLPSGKYGLIRKDPGSKKPLKYLGVSSNRKQTITSHGNRGCGGIEVKPGGGGGVENLVRAYEAIRLAQKPKPPAGAAGYSTKSANFRRFDKNKDGVITDDELVLFVIAPHRNRVTTGGAARPLNVTGLTDAKGTLSVKLKAGLFTDLISFLTFAHEAVHLFGALDLYGGDGDSNKAMTLMGPSLHKADSATHALHLDPYHKIRFGWVEPRMKTATTFECATLKAPTGGGKPATFTQRPIVIRDPAVTAANAGAYVFEYRLGHGKKNYDRAFYSDGRCIEGMDLGACRVVKFSKPLKEACIQGDPPCPYWIDTRYNGIFSRARKSGNQYVCDEGTRSGHSNCKVYALPKLKGECYPGSRRCFYWIDTAYDGLFSMAEAVSKTRDGVLSWWVGQKSNACGQGGCKKDKIATYIKAGSSGTLKTHQPLGDDVKKNGRIEPGPNRLLETTKHPKDAYELKQYDVSTVGRENGKFSFGTRSAWGSTDGVVRLPVRHSVSGNQVSTLGQSSWWFRVGKRRKGKQLDLAWGTDKAKLTAWTGACPSAETRALKLYVSAKRRDAFTAATQAGYGAAKSAKYAQWGGIQGRIFAREQPGTVPLKLYWSSERKDNFSTATAWGEAAAKWAGYTFVRIQGYVYPNTDPRPGTVPLRSFWGKKVGWLDNWTTTDAGVIDLLEQWGWLATGIQGYILKPKPGHRGRSKKPKTHLIAKAKKVKRQKAKPRRDFGKYLAQTKAKRRAKRSQKFSKGFKKDCRKALKSVCKKATAKAGGRVKCLRENRNKLSRACRKRLETLKSKDKRKTKSNRVGHIRFKRHCSRDLNKHCKRIKPSQHFKCLKRHEKKLSKACRKQVRKTRQSKPIR